MKEKQKEIVKSALLLAMTKMPKSVIIHQAIEIIEHVQTDEDKEKGISPK